MIINIQMALELGQIFTMLVLQLVTYQKYIFRQNPEMSDLGFGYLLKIYWPIQLIQWIVLKLHILTKIIKLKKTLIVASQTTNTSLIY